MLRFEGGVLGGADPVDQGRLVAVAGQLGRDGRGDGGLAPFEFGERGVSFRGVGIRSSLESNRIRGP